MTTIDARMAAVLSARAAHIAACQAYADATRLASETRIALSLATAELHEAESSLQREMVATLGAPIHKPIRKLTLDNAGYSKLTVNVR